jgi:hypothetical protein
VDNQRHGIRASGDYATYEGREYLAWGTGERVRLLSDDDPLPPGFELSPKIWVRGEALIPKASIQRLLKRRTTCRWRGHRFEVGIIIGDLANLTYLDGNFDEVCRLPGMHRPDKYEVIGKVPVKELAELEESTELPAAEADIVDALRARIRRGDGLSVPYARRWEIGGCEPNRSLGSHPEDGLRLLAAGLIDLGRPLFAGADTVIIVGWPKNSWVAVNRDRRGEGAPDTYLCGLEGERPPRYVGNAAEVVVEIMRQGYGSTARTPPDDSELQVGFPGLQNTTTTYVGSWRWGVHGEASDTEFVRRAATATLRAIDAKKQRDAAG